jgi:hypothetical protein
MRSLNTLNRIDDLNYGTGDYTFDELTSWALSQGLLQPAEVDTKRQTLQAETYTSFVRGLYTMPPEGVPGSIVDYAQQLSSWAQILKNNPGYTWADVVRAFNWTESNLVAYVQRAYQSVYDSIMAINATPISEEAKRAFTAHVLARRAVVPELFSEVFGITFDGPLTEPRYLPDPILGNTRRVSTVDATPTSDGYLYELLRGWIGVIPAGSLPALIASTGGGQYNEPFQFTVDFGTGEPVTIWVGERSRVPFSARALAAARHCPQSIPGQR